MASSSDKDSPISRPSVPSLLKSRGKGGGIPARPAFEMDSTKITALRAPAPLPPSPADSDPGGWLDQAPTDPVRIPDLGALASSGSGDDASIPGWARESPPADASEELSGPHRQRDSGRLSGAIQPQAGFVVPPIVMLLLVAVCVSVGMIVGALMQSRYVGPDTCPDPAAHSQKNHSE